MNLIKYCSFIILFSVPIGLQAQNELMEMLFKSEKFRAESKYDSALSISLKVLDEARDIQDYEFQGRAALEIASVYILTRRYDFALEMCDDAIEYSRLANIEHIGMTAVYNKGLALINKGYLDSALIFYNQAEVFFRKESENKMLGNVLSAISGLHRLKKDRVLAIKNGIKAAEIYARTGQSRYLANRYFWIGEDYFVLHENPSSQSAMQLDSAKWYFDKCFQLSDSLSYPDPKFKALRGLSVVAKLKGDLEEALRLMYLSGNITQELYSQNVEDKLLDIREKYNTANLEIKALREERSKNAVLIIGISIIVLISIWLYVVDQRRKSIKALAEKNDQINKQKIDDLLQEQEIASLQGVLEGQETERKRVAIDLHDRLGGILSMVKLHFSAVEEKIDEENPNKKKFLTASELLDLAAGEVRNISHDMMSGVLAKFGLVPALEDLKRRISETGQLDFNLIVNLKNSTLSGEQELQLYRIVQELISNILKHSKATETNIQLNENDGSVNLIVEDDGVGFETKQLQSADGIGLSNLKARVAKLEGTFHVDSGKGAGTTISIDIPVEND